MKYPVWAALSLLLCFSACNDRKDIDQLTKEVMSVHNEAMAKMDSMMQMKAELKTKEGSEKPIQDLDAARKSMMDWMHGYRPVRAGAPKDSAISYLRQEQTSARDMKLRIEQSLQEARQWLKDHENTK